MPLTNQSIFLVTGGLGFIGGHFVELILQNGFQVINIDKITYAANPRLNDCFQKQYPKQYQFIKKDINDLTELPYCHYIVNFAAESHVDNSINDGDVFIKSNILGVKNILNLLKKAKEKNQQHLWSAQLPPIIYISTDEVFGDIEKGCFQINDRHNPSNPYSASKSAAEMLVLAHSRTYGFPYQITRTTNNYGPRQHPEKLIPHCITQILSNQRIKIHGSGNQIRNWIHVQDNVSAIFQIITQGKLNETYHIASDEECSVNEIVKIILETANKTFDHHYVEYVLDRSSQDIRYAIDYSKTKLLGWSPQKNIKSTIKEIIKFYEDQQKNNSLV